jgi:hypothetical protein
MPDFRALAATVGGCAEAFAAPSLEGVSEAAAEVVVEDLEVASVGASQDRREELAEISLTRIFMPIILDLTNRLPAGSVWTDMAVAMVQRTPAMT